MILLSAFLIGVLAGLRSVTAPAATAWAGYLGWLRLERPLSLLGSLPAALILTVLAVGELVIDKLPRTPNRTAPLGVIARMISGGVAGACIASSGGFAVLAGAALGAAGGIAGCFGGFYARTRLAKAMSGRGVIIALVEDLVAVAGSLILLQLQ
jgi:uncharacterized membrane protein